jgi:hypothetical protein
MPPQRLIRRQSLWDRLSSYPHDLLLSLNESYELLEWDSLSDMLSIPFGVWLNLLYLIARRGQLEEASSALEVDVFEGSARASGDGGGLFEGSGGGLQTLVCFHVGSPR